MHEYTSRGKRRSANAPHMTNLIHFYTDADIHQHTTYLVDALWDINPNLLRDWECMTQLLLDDDSQLKVKFHFSTITQFPARILIEHIQPIYSCDSEFQTDSIKSIRICSKNSRYRRKTVFI